MSFSKCHDDHDAKLYSSAAQSVAWLNLSYYLGVVGVPIKPDPTQ